VIVSMAEIAESAKEGLLALAVGTGMQVTADPGRPGRGQGALACGPGRLR
jgi:hypothetical protein